jgi:threonine dehydratase
LPIDKDEVMRRGVFTCSAGNMGQGVAKFAQVLGVQCTVVVPDTAPATKLEAMIRLGATIVKVTFSEWWTVLEQGAGCKLLQDQPFKDAVFVHPVADQRVLTGNSTIALEILEDLPDVDAVLVPFGGGALACGIGSVIKEVRGDRCKVYGCEPSTASPLTESFKQGARCEQFESWQPSFVDGCGGKAVLTPIWPVAQAVLDGGFAVELDDVADAIRVLVEQNRVVAEGAGGCAVAAARTGMAKGCKKIVCVVSGGGLDTNKLLQILARCPEQASLTYTPRLLTPLSLCVSALDSLTNALD